MTLRSRYMIRIRRPAWQCSWQERNNNILNCKILLLAYIDLGLHVPPIRWVNNFFAEVWR